MAASLATQSMLASPVAAARVSRRSAFLLPRQLQRNVNFAVRCMAAGDDEQKLADGQQLPPTKPQQPPIKAQQPRMSTKFSDVLAFSGPAPERINGRLAMVGFVAALAVELSKGQDVFAQISNGGAAWFLGTSVLLTVASLVPLLKGVSVESKSDGLFTSDAELLNGRFAMLGLVALVVTEYAHGGLPLV